MWLNGGAFCDSKDSCLDRCDPNHDGVSPLFLPKEIKKELSQEVDNHLCTADNRPSIHSNYSFFSPEPQNPLHDYWCLMIILMILMMTRMILTTTRIILMMTRMISTMTRLRHVRVPYCTSDTWAGRRNPSEETNGYAFHGKNVFRLLSFLFPPTSSWSFILCSLT